MARAAAHPQTQAHTSWQGLTLVHFSAQVEPCLTHKSTVHSLNNPYHPLNAGFTTPARTPIPQKALELSREVSECKPLLPGDNSDYCEQNLMSEAEPSSGELVYGRGLHSSTFQINLSHFGHTCPCSPV